MYQFDPKDEYSKIIKRSPLMMYRSSRESDILYKTVTSTVLDTIRKMKVNRIVITNSLSRLMDERLWYYEVEQMMKEDGTLLIFADFFIFRDLHFISEQYEVKMMIDENKLYNSSRNVDSNIKDYPENRKSNGTDQTI